MSLCWWLMAVTTNKMPPFLDMRHCECQSVGCRCDYCSSETQLGFLSCKTDAATTQHIEYAEYQGSDSVIRARTTTFLLAARAEVWYKLQNRHRMRKCPNRLRVLYCDIGGIIERVERFDGDVSTSRTVY